MTYSKNRAIVLAIIEGGLSITDAATQFSVTTRWIRTLLSRYNTHGLEGLEPRSRAPHHNPNATPQPVRDRILELRKHLVAQGLDAGAESIHDRLPPEHRPSPATIWRILRAGEAITPQPQKRPRSSWHRFEADAPNGLWQSDFTHWQLADGTDIEIISWLDDHARFLLHASPHERVTGPIVIDSFLAAADTYDLPAATLTDNGMVYTTRLARGANGQNFQPNAFEQLLADLSIEQKNGRPGHPTTQGKIERFHQTLKRWLAARAAPHTLADLQLLLDDFRAVYNTERPHRALNRATPHEVYHRGIKDFPRLDTTDQQWRVRYDTIDGAGVMTLRYAGKLRHLGIGRAHNRTRVIALVNGPNVMVISRRGGEIIAEFTIDPAKDYQPKHRK
ncbi:IS481 family transposase [Gulosibacter chungangensis]|uniref:IS481 family transposase n=1 Tax=Gulosibacter chungangensis TaxID=979746 RepID=A0A7J5BF10_9MICO|nr:IS481 family transposase [Gulosibacter chungangensis]KAB1644841.1 IS481 family transposase [Gulosibacter chungangensis]